MITMTQDECINCGGSESLEHFQINDFDGFCHSSKRMKICTKCTDNNSQITEVGLFLKLEDGLFYHTGWGVYEKVKSKNQLDRIFNRDYYELLRHIQ
ncbi:hypothetical protein [Paenibacillus medicaginis]|uniref:Uncharacterized protein n=1 Tax=Paenibacillus medicaginis TaxID=1470560 RepID=A0ABV5BUS3_9BACL